MSKFEALTRYLYETLPEWFSGSDPGPEARYRLREKGHVNIEELADRILAWKEPE